MSHHRTEPQAPPLGTTVVDTRGGPAPETVLGWVRTLLAGCLGVGAAGLLRVGGRAGGRRQSRPGRESG